MASLTPIYQKYFPVYSGRKVSITKVQTLTTSDTVSIEAGQAASDNVSVRQLWTVGGVPTSTVSHASATGLATLTTTARNVGNIVYIIGVHTDKNSSSIG